MYQEYENRRKQYDGRQGQSARHPCAGMETGVRSAGGEAKIFRRGRSALWRRLSDSSGALRRALFLFCLRPEESLDRGGERVVYEAMAADTIKIPEIKYIFFK